MQVELDNIDSKLLNIIQAEFPLTREPFSALGRRLGVSGDEVVHRIEGLKAKGVIRLIGPVFNPGRLGYQTSLLAMKVATDRLHKAAEIISAHPQVSHCYERDHDFNLWFTLALAATQDLDTEARELGSRVKAEVTLNLPAVRTFKIGAYFNTEAADSSVPKAAADNTRVLSTDVDLSSVERAVVNEVQQDLPLTARPFDLMSTHLSLDVDGFLNHCQALLQRGVMRRFSASISHRSLGFVANAMACWKVPPEMVETAGSTVATFQEVSHCYERKTSPLWPYNLYAMMHAKSREACENIARRASSVSGLDENGPVLLFSTREAKKTRARYLT